MGPKVQARLAQEFHKWSVTGAILLALDASALRSIGITIPEDITAITKAIARVAVGADVVDSGESAQEATARRAEEVQAIKAAAELKRAALNSTAAGDDIS